MATSTHTVQVLVVDDHAPFRGAAGAVLAATPGFESVGEAASGAEGLALAVALRPDLVLLDVKMPGLDGIDTSRLLTATNPDAVVVLISVDDDLVLSEAPSECGAVAFLRKQDLRPAALRAIWAEHGHAPRVPLTPPPGEPPSLGAARQSRVLGAPPQPEPIA